jgi:hypothetical protein
VRARDHPSSSDRRPAAAGRVGVVALRRAGSLSPVTPRYARWSEVRKCGISGGFAARRSRPCWLVLPRRGRFVDNPLTDQPVLGSPSTVIAPAGGHGDIAASKARRPEHGGWLSWTVTQRRASTCASWTRCRRVISGSWPRLISIGSSPSCWLEASPPSSAGSRRTMRGDQCQSARRDARPRRAPTDVVVLDAAHRCSSPQRLLTQPRAPSSSSRRTPPA